ncbi:hypothetical protein F4818DRAFT_451820, partial [Hypoxylon cercidicola]
PLLGWVKFVFRKIILSFLLPSTFFTNAFPLLLLEMSTTSTDKMAWNATNELSHVELERDDFLYQMVLEIRTMTRESFDRELASAEQFCIRSLCDRLNQPPCVSREYLRWLAGLNWFHKRFKGTGREWPLAEEQPETHAEPYSLAYIEYWYDKNVGDPTEKDEPADREARVVPSGVQPTSPELLMPIWKNVMKDQEVGVRPFEIAIPFSRDTSKVISEPGEEEPVLAEVSALLGPEVTVFCQLGGLFHPTTVFLGLGPGVDASNLGTCCRVGWAWKMLLAFGIRVSKEDTNILTGMRLLVEEDMQFGLNLDPFHAAFQKEQDKVYGLDEERRQKVIKASQRSAKIARLCDAQHREMDRLAEEVSSKLLNVDKSFAWKVQKLQDFIEFGDPGIPLSKPAARARVAERRVAMLAADLVKQIIQSNSSMKQPGLLRAFILDGDDRLPTLDDPMVRLGVVQEVWPPLAQEKSKSALKRCKAALSKAREEIERRGSNEEDFDDDEDDLNSLSDQGQSAEADVTKDLEALHIESSE